MPRLAFITLLATALLIAVAGEVIGASLLPSPAPVPEVVHSSGVFAVPTSWFFDLDEGRLVRGTPEDDLILEDTPPAYFEPDTG